MEKSKAVLFWQVGVALFISLTELAFFSRYDIAIPKDAKSDMRRRADNAVKSSLLG